MWSITLKLMRKTKRMLIPAGIAIMIGTAFIASTFLFGNAMNDSLTRQLTAMFGNANYAVTVNSSDLSDKELNEAYSSTVGDFHLDQIAGIEGVGGVRASVETGVSVSKGDSTVSGEIISTAAQKNMLPVNITEGDQPKDSNEVALPEDMAKQLNVGVGDTVSLTSRYAVGDDGKAKADNVRVVGLTSDPNGAYSYYGGAIVGSNNLLAAMQGVDDFNATGTTMVYLDLALDGNSVSAKTINGVKALLPKHFDLMSRQQISDESIKSLSGNQTNIVTTFLMCFGVLAMFVAALVIANTFQVLVAQRRRTLALLRTIGAKKGQLYGSVLFEAVVLGFVASVLGVVLGSLLDVGHVRQRHHARGYAVQLLLASRRRTDSLRHCGDGACIHGIRTFRHAVTPLEALRPIELTDNRRSQPHASHNRYSDGGGRYRHGHILHLAGAGHQRRRGGEQRSIHDDSAHSHRRRRTGVPRHGGHRGVLDADPHEGRWSVGLADRTFRNGCARQHSEESATHRSNRCRSAHRCHPGFHHRNRCR